MIIVVIISKIFIIFIFIIFNIIIFIFIIIMFIISIRGSTAPLQWAPETAAAVTKMLTTECTKDGRRTHAVLSSRSVEQSREPRPLKSLGRAKCPNGGCSDVFTTKREFQNRFAHKST